MLFLIFINKHIIQSTIKSEIGGLSGQVNQINNIKLYNQLYIKNTKTTNLIIFTRVPFVRRE